MEEISLKDYLTILRKRKTLIITIMALSILVAAIGTGLITNPEYKSSTTMIVKGPEKQGQSDNDQKYLNQKLMNTYSEIIKSKAVMDKVEKNLSIDLSAKDIINNIEVENILDTDIIEINVVGKEPKLVAKAADEIAKMSMEYAKPIIDVENIEILDEARISKGQARSNLRSNIIIGGILGLVISIFIAFLLEYLDTTIKTPKDVKRHLGLSTIGIVTESENDLVVYEEPNSFAAETYRSLRTNIQSIKEEKKIKSILITSSNPNENRSIVSVNAAIAMSHIGKVLLIDGDLREPQIHNLLNMGNEKGLSNVLLEAMDYKEVINETEIGRNLDVLTSGPIKSNPAELLSSSRMKEFINKVEKEYDTIILSSTSLGVMTDSVALSNVVEGTILVCESGESQIENVKIGKELLEKVNTNILGVVLNKVNVQKSDYYKYYYDSYSYYK